MMAQYCTSGPEAVARQEIHVAWRSLRPSAGHAWPASANVLRIACAGAVLLVLLRCVTGARAEEPIAEHNLDVIVRAGSDRAIPLACDRDPSGLAGLQIEDGRVVDATILHQLRGFAAAAGTTGGLGKRLFHVTSTDDYDPHLLVRLGVPGSLRAAVQQATNEGGGWILFDPALGPAPTFALRQQLTLPADVTLDGGCAGATLSTPTDVSTLVVYRPNVIITRLRLLRPDARHDNDGGDCIAVARDFDRLAVMHNEFGFCGHGQMDITRPAPRGRERRVTVANNRFHDHNMPMLVEAQECRVGEMVCADPLNQADLPHIELYLSVLGNLFERTSQRHPDVDGNVFLHSANNVIAFENYRYAYGAPASAYGLSAGNGARILAEDDLIFQARQQTRNVPLAIWNARAPHALHSPFPPGAIRARRILTAGKEVVWEDRPELVPDLPPDARRGQIDFAAAGADRAIHCVLAMAGRAGADTLPADCPRLK